jgi:hypothetical protein
MISLLDVLKENDMRAAINQAQEPTREYVKTSSYQYKPEKARFKLAVYFKDGNKRYFSSYDNMETKEGRHVDEYTGMMKLLRLINTYEGKYKTAVIYATMDQDKPTNSNYNFELLKYDMYGNKKTNKTANFLTEGKNVIFDIKRANYLNKFKI